MVNKAVVVRLCGEEEGEVFDDDRKTFPVLKKESDDCALEKGLDSCRKYGRTIKVKGTVEGERLETAT